MHRKKIFLEMSRVSTYGRRVLAGVSRYCRERQMPWRFYCEPIEVAHPTGPLEDFHPDGAIVNRGHIGEVSASWLAGASFPVVNVAVAPIPGAVQVIPDDEAIGAAAAEHFRERNYTHFAFAGFQRDPWESLRFRGFAARLAQEGFEPRTLVLEWGYEKKQWERRMATCGRWLRSAVKPVAIMAGNDMAGGIVIESCRYHDIKVPEEVGVVGVNDNPLICQFTAPPMSSVPIDGDLLGYTAAETLGAMIAGGQPPPVCRMPPRPVATRQSSDVMMVDDPVVARAVAYIRENISTCRSVDDLLEALPVSRRDLERRFARSLRRGPWQEIRRMQLKRARSLLSETDLSLERIGRLCGLGNAKRLGEVLRKELGVSPTRYRARCRGE